MAKIDEVMFTAQEAKRVAEAARDLSQAVAGHLNTIAASIEAMRSENSTDHARNAKIMVDGFEKVHERISSVKQTQDINRNATMIQFNDVEKTMLNVQSDLTAKIEAARNEAKAGDHTVETQNSKRWEKLVWTVLKVLGGMIAGLVAYKSGLNIMGN